MPVLESSSALRKPRAISLAHGIAALLAGAAFLAGICLLAWPFLCAHLRSIALLDQVSGNPVPPTLARLVTYPVTVQDLTVPAPSGAVRARLYLPAGISHAPAMIVLHGVHHLGIDEPRLQSFARGLASCGLQVLTPELPGIKDYRIGPESVRTIGESTLWFSRRTGGRPVGVLGISFSGGLALVAAEDPAYARAMKFILAVGSQDSMPRVAAYYRTGRDPRPTGPVQVLPAHDYGPLVLEYEHLEDFVSPAGIPGLRAVLRAHLYEDPIAERAAFQALTPAQQILARRLMNAADPATLAALAASASRHTAEMQALSPSGRLQDLRVPVFLLHGEADNVIPAAETLWMEQELPRPTLQAALISPVLSHVDVARQLTAKDEWRLVHLFALMLHAARQ